jgi:hypothetical protein
MVKSERAWLGALILLLSFAPATVRAAPTPSVTVPAGIAAAIVRLTRPLDAVPLPAIPSNPVAALIAAVNAHSASLGFPVDHSTVIWSSGITPEYAGRVAQLMQAVLGCATATTATQRLNCATAANDAAAGVIRTAAPFFRDIQAWPSLYVDGDGRNDVYVYDYTVLIDRGGNDIYENNAGGNFQDIKWGPPGSAAPSVGPAIGCEQVTGNFPAPTATAHDCIAAPQVVFIDQKSASLSNDIYGVFRSPRTVDHNPPLTGSRKVDGNCTGDRLIRRIVLQGSGFEGNGLLIDVGGDDRYRGNTAAQGSGHLGVGVLRDLGGGVDEYLAIRNSQGFSLVGTLGLLQDDGGNDRYHTYMPAPLDPSADFQEDGSGGVVDDTGLCDNLPRMVQGAALLGGVGHLLDEDGKDTYVGAPPGTQPFAPGVLFFHSSQGFGCDSGVGSLNDRGADRDRYLEGPAGRRRGIHLGSRDGLLCSSGGQYLPRRRPAGTGGK